MPFPIREPGTGVKLSGLAIVAVACILLGSRLSAREEDPQKQLQHALRLYKTGNSKKAERVCRNVLKENPSLGDAHELLGIVLEREGREREAFAEYSAAISISPTIASYRFVLGTALERENNLDEALEQYRIAHELDPNDQQIRRAFDALTQEIEIVAQIKANKAKGGDKTTEPVPIFRPDPPYTPEARRAKLQGTIRLLIIIGTDGKVLSARIQKGIDPGLDKNAVETVRTWTFKPASRNGVAVPVRVLVEVTFRLF